MTSPLHHRRVCSTLLRAGLPPLVSALIFLCPVPASTGAAPSPQPSFQAITVNYITVHYTPGDNLLASGMASLGSDLHRRIRDDLDLREHVAVDLYLLRDEHFGGGSGESSPLPAPWIAGTADPGRRIILVRLYPGRSSTDYRSTLAHELTHVILEADYPDQRQWPRWFREGLAMRQSGSEGFRHGTALFLASFRGRLHSLDELQQGFPSDEASSRLAYAESYSVIAFLHARYGAASFRHIMQNLRSRSFEEAFTDIYGMSLPSLEREWLRYVSRRYSWIPLITGASTFWFVSVVIFFLSLLARRRKTLAIRREWEKEEGLF